jgi:putative ABC transport system substrate-binding protein
MRRRQFIKLLGGGATAWPLAARAQQPAIPVVAFLDAAPLETDVRGLAEFRKGLSEIGYRRSKRNDRVPIGRGAG